MLFRASLMLQIISFVVVFNSIFGCLLWFGMHLLLFSPLYLVNILNHFQCCLVFCQEVGCWFFIPRIVNVVFKRRLFEDMPMISRLMITNERLLWGGFFIIFGSTFFGGFLYTAVISKLLPRSNNAVFLAIQNDRYECWTWITSSSCCF